MINNEIERYLCNVLEGHFSKRSAPSPMVLMRMKKQEVLLYGGFSVRNIYLLLEGHCGVSTVNEDGSLTIADLYQPVQIFGISEYLAGIPEFLANVYISSDSALILSCPADYFASCVRNCQELSVLLNGYLAKLLVRNMRSSEETLYASPKQQLMEYFFIHAIDKDLPYVYPISRDDLANQLRLNPRTLYRYLRQLEEEGYIGNRHGKTMVDKINYELLEQIFTKKGL
ncbi:MAG: Crp/Fnr family transcriptional regulator [Oscillospiraceae bacterium]|nr:Crp/Fnr family transcriptional regulator [Oscillospiraceae bacterium]